MNAYAGGNSETGLMRHARENHDESVPRNLIERVKITGTAGFA